MITTVIETNWKLSARSPTVQSRILELIVFNLIGWIPHPIGSLVRKLIYPAMFARMGNKVSVFQGVEFIGTSAMEISDRVKILGNSRLEIKDTNSFIFLDRGVCLDCGVDIRTAGANCWIEIGENSYLGSYVCIAGPGNIKIGKDCQIASQSGIYANNYQDYGLSLKGIVIQDKCKIGRGVKILDGVTIGTGSVIEAGAVVTNDIPPYSIAVGVPAKVIKHSKNGAA